MNAEMPLARLVRVGHRHHRVPGRLAAVGDPRLGAVEDPVVAVGLGPGAHRRRVAAGLPLGQRVGRHRLTRRRSTAAPCFFSSSEPRRIRPIVPSLFTAGISDADASTRATSSITMHAATESAPWPPYSSGTCTALKPEAFSASSASCGKREFSSTSAAMRRDLLLRQRPDRRPQLVVLLGQLEHIERSGFPAHHSLLATRR